MQIEKILAIFQVVNNICDILKQQKNFLACGALQREFFHTASKCWSVYEDWKMQQKLD